MEQELEGFPEVRTLFSTIGAGTKRRANEVQIFVGLNHKSQRQASQADVIRRARDRIGTLGLPLRD